MAAGRAIARGIERYRPEAQIAIHAVADGGEGTIDALSSVPGTVVDHIRATGSMGEAVTARVLTLRDVRVVEASEVTGVSARPGGHSALEATSYGLGQTIGHAARDGSEVLVATGGTGSTDGGTGMARALGWRFLDRRGRDLPAGGGALVDLSSVVPPPEQLDLAVTGLRDVDSPLLGERGAARMFAPQKGAGPAEVAVLEQGLETLAEVVLRDLGTDLARIVGGGAGGGIGAGLTAFLGARSVPGFERIAGETSLPDALEGADLVVTGEGHFDEGSLGGKVPVGVAGLAGWAGVPCALVAGRISVSEARFRVAGIAIAVSLEELVGAQVAIAEPEESLALATVEMMRRGGY